MRHWLPLSAGVLWLAFSLPAQSLGLGASSETSALNQPLHVLFPLTDTTGLAPEQITVTLGDEAAYQRAGLERTALLDGLSAQVVRSDGRLAVELESERRVRDPFLDLLLVVTWPDGQWQRQLSLLFDPAGYAQAQPLLSGDAGKAPVSVSPVPRLVSANSPAGGAPTSAWPTRLAVQGGDSLSSLAASLLPHEGVGRHALMLALYRANPEAFVGGDVNRLRAGVTLIVPSAAEVAGQAEGAALAALRQHTSRSPADADDASGDGLTTIEIEGARQQGEADVAPLGVIASLQSQVAGLTADNARQQAAIASLEAQRDRLAAALGTLSPPAEDTATTPVAPVHAGATERDDGAPMLPAVETAAADAVAAPVSGRSQNNARPWWQWPLAHPEGAGGVALACLLALWGVQRSRGRRGHIEPAEGERATDTPKTLETAEVMSGADASETKAAKSGKRSRFSLSRGRTDSNRETESSVIDQADIYLAYGRYEEARDWLVPRLDDDPEGRRRLGLIRALGELRDLDGMEAAFARVDATLPVDTRRQAQALVDEYRARYVEESWEEATAGAAPAGTTIDDVDALFEAETQRQPAPVGPGHVTTAQKIPVAPDIEVPVVPGSAPTTPANPDSSARPEAFEAAPQATSIAYEPPPLEWSSASPDDEMDSESAARPSAATLEFAPLPSVMTPLGVDEDGNLARAPETPVTASRNSEVPPASRQAAIPDDWEVEVVEFHSPHRDNRRP